MKEYIPVKCKSILITHKEIDDWFGARYYMNVYRGCKHACVYCDGRSEKYYINGEFDKDITVKINAAEVLKNELTKIKDRTFICAGGGIGDVYQPLERRLELMKDILTVLKDTQFGVYILTKSVLIKRDIEFIKQINNQSRCVVCISISTVDEKVASIFEPYAPSPIERLNILKQFHDANIPTGVWFVPVIPFISDDIDVIDETIHMIKEAKAGFVLFGNMTLRQGQQKQYFLNIIKKRYPELVEKYSMYEKIIDKEYIERINKHIYKICKKYRIAPRMPLEIFCNALDTRYIIAMILLHIRYFLNQEGIDRPAYSIAAKNIQNLSNIDMLYKQSRLAEIPGVGKRIAKMIEEIISTGRCEYYDKLRSCFDIPKYSLPSVIMYTDGACKGNPGPGGWAAIIISDNGRTKQELTGKEPVTTNNRMELIASIEGLKAIRQPSYVKIYSDSAYLVNAFNQHWVDKWQANNWQLSDKKSKVKNYELWQELIKLTQFHHVEWIKVKGHGEDEYNKQCDKLAVRAAESIS